MSEEKTNRVLDFVTGILLGTLGGMVAGILWAPRSGAESRHQLSEGIREAKDKTNKYVEDTKQSTEDILNQVKNVLEDKFHLLVEAVQAGKQAAEKTHSQLHSSHSNGGDVVNVEAEPVREK